MGPATQPEPEATQPEPEPEATQPEQLSPEPAVAAPPGPAAQVIEARGLRIDPAQGSVSVAGRPVDLSDDEFELLLLLMTGARRALSRSVLARLLIGPAEAPTDADRRAVDDLAARLREKLGDTGPRPQWIESVPGIGYRRTLH